MTSVISLKDLDTLYVCYIRYISLNTLVPLNERRGKFYSFLTLNISGIKL